MFSTWFRGRSSASPRRQSAPASAPRFRKCLLELLEDRTLLSNAYLVNLAGDATANTGTPSGTFSGDLRYCIVQADANAGSTITFDTAATGPTIALAQGELAISASMTITGPGAGSLTVTGNSGTAAGSSRVFDVTSTAAGVGISGLTITGGNASSTTSPTPGAFGGDIRNTGTLTLTNDVVSGGVAMGTVGNKANGGGILNAGSLTVSGTTVTGDMATGGTGGAGTGNGGPGGTGGTARGGGIYSGMGTHLTLVNGSQVTGDMAVGGAGGVGAAATTAGGAGGRGGSGGSAAGGGVFSSGTLGIFSTTFSGDTAQGGLGGAGAAGADGTPSTTANGGLGGTGGAGGLGGSAFGGGVCSTSGSVGIDQSPFSNDQALSGGGGKGGAGGLGGATTFATGTGGTGGTGGRGGDQGVAQGGGVFSNGGDLTVSNSPFTSNTAQTGVAGDGGVGGAGGAGLTAANTGNGGVGGAGGGRGSTVTNLGSRTYNADGSSAFGGGIAVTAGNLSITGSAFSQNHAVGGPAGQGGGGGTGFTGGVGGAGGAGASSWGGGVSASKSVGNVTISGSPFTGNTNTSSPGGAGGLGGAGDATGGTGGTGGAGGVGGSSWGGGFSYHIQSANSHTTANTVSVTSSPFSSNAITSSVGGRGGDGGAGNNGGQGGQGGGSFDAWGGGLSIKDQGGPTNLTVDSSQFLSNTATVLAGGAGGAGGVAGASGTGGTGGKGGFGASPWGGGIAISSGASFSLTNSPLTNNIATATAGGAGGAGGAAGAGGTGGQGGQGGNGDSAWGGGIVFEPKVFNSTAGSSSINSSPVSGNQAIGAVGGAGGAGGSTFGGGSTGGQGGKGGAGGSSWGGGVDVSNGSSSTPFGSVTLNSSPVTNNVLTARNGGAGGAGGSGATGGPGNDGGDATGSAYGAGIASDNYNLILNSSPVSGNQGASGGGGKGGDGGQGTAGGGGMGGKGGHGASAHGGGIDFTGGSNATGLNLTINASDVTNNTLTQGSAGAGGNGGTGTTTGGPGGPGGSQTKRLLDGAGVSVRIGNAQITNSNIDGNIGTAGAGGAGGQGGAGGTGAAGGGNSGGAGGSALGGGVYFKNPTSHAETFSFSGGSASNNTLTSGAGGAGGAAGTGATTGVQGGTGGAGGSAFGGGIYLHASGSGGITSTIDRAVLDDNTLTSGAGGRGGDGGAGGNGNLGGSAQGGGVYNGPRSALTLTNSTLAGDHISSGAGGGGGNGSAGKGGKGGKGGSALGGGVYSSAGASLTVTNSTFGGTSADPTRPDQNRDIVSAGAGGAGGAGGVGANGGNGGGGGSALGGGVFTTGTATFRDDTITANQALAFGAGGAGGVGGAGGTAGTAGTSGQAQAGGYFVGNGTNNVGNTIIALNAAATDPDVSGSFTSQGHNIIGIIGDATGFVASDIIGVTAAMLNLGPLLNYGGPTPTDALLPGSIAIDAGDNALIPGGFVFDQRGPGFTRIFNGVVDVGAFEFGPSGAIVVPGTNGNDTLVLSQTPGFGPGAITYVLDGGPPVELFNVTSFTFDGLGGDDTMIVNIPPGGVLVVGEVFFDGGPGFNTLVVNANGKTVKIEQAAQTITVADPQTIGYANVQAINLNSAATVTAIAGPDTADRPTAFAGLTAEERFVQALYLDELGRAGSVSELDGWVALFNAPGSSQAQAQALIATDIQHSQEALDHLVKSWYVAFLGRSAQNGEERGWVALLQQGQSEEQVLGQILASDEFYARSQTLITSGTADQRFVQALYLLLLDRTGEGTGVASWLGVLATQGRHGVTLGFLHGPEFRADQFEGYYNALLRRPDDSGGLNGWVFSNLDMASVRIGFEATTEFYTNG